MEENAFHINYTIYCDELGLTKSLEIYKKSQSWEGISYKPFKLFLTKGMKEILEEVKEHDGKSDVIIQCPALEKLVGILDARHLWGSYHPAMNLKAQIDKLEGANTELRDQIRKARLEEDKLTNYLQRTKAKMTSMEAELSELRDAEMLQQNTAAAGGKGGGGMY